MIIHELLRLCSLKCGARRDVGNRLVGMQEEEVVTFPKMQNGQFPLGTKESWGSLTLNIR
jgi:hypothetical protein